MSDPICQTVMRQTRNFSSLCSRCKR
ncbi:MAG: hypothetical protein E7057_06575 [Lentisphaerae bacterium]|nr:hypothetical protein [Lentisphaerota bacterium]